MSLNTNNYFKGLSADELGDCNDVSLKKAKKKLREIENLEKKSKLRANFEKDTMLSPTSGCNIDFNPFIISSELSAITIFLFKPY